MHSIPLYIIIPITFLIVIPFATPHLCLLDHALHPPLHYYPNDLSHCFIVCNISFLSTGPCTAPPCTLLSQLSFSMSQSLQHLISVYWTIHCIPLYIIIPITFLIVLLSATSHFCPMDHALHPPVHYYPNRPSHCLTVCNTLSLSTGTYTASPCTLLFQSPFSLFYCLQHLISVYWTMHCISLYIIIPITFLIVLTSATPHLSLLDHALHPPVHYYPNYNFSLFYCLQHLISVYWTMHCIPLYIIITITILIALASETPHLCIQNHAQYPPVHHSPNRPSHCHNVCNTSSLSTGPCTASPCTS